MNQQDRIAHWEDIYNEKIDTLPWFYRALDPDLGNALHRKKIHSGTCLDLGTGPATQAIALAKLGFEVTATDISPLAIKKARSRAAKEKIQIEFLQDDIFRTQLRAKFDFLWDRGCFHCTEPAKRRTYVRRIQRLIRPGGYLFLKCFSSREPGTRGPFRFSPLEIRELFSPYFRIHSITHSVYHGTRRPLPRALFCVLQKKSG